MRFIAMAPCLAEYIMRRQFGIPPWFPMSVTITRSGWFSPVPARSARGIRVTPALGSRQRVSMQPTGQSASMCRSPGMQPRERRNTKFAAPRVRLPCLAPGKRVLFMRTPQRRRALCTITASARVTNADKVPLAPQTQAGAALRRPPQQYRLLRPQYPPFRQRTRQRQHPSCPQSIWKSMARTLRQAWFRPAG